MHPATFSLVTPAGADGSAAIAAIHIHADVDHLFPLLHMTPVGVGAVALRDFGGHDRGVVARPNDSTLLLMPHAGPAVLKSILAWLTSRGVTPAASLDPAITYPEARADVEACMLAALARPSSPLAIDLLLDQPRRWKELGVESREQAESLSPASLHTIRTLSAVLNRLLRPPIIVALGRPNIGKSTLLNTLARRAVSLVADEPGTTRDHVGVRLDLAGLVVHYIDTPGIEPAPTDPIQIEAQSLALQAAAAADLLLLCADSASDFVPPLPHVPSLRISLRADRGSAHPRADLAVSARTGAAIDQLVSLIRESLIPSETLNAPTPWLFW